MTQSFVWFNSGATELVEKNTRSRPHSKSLNFFPVSTFDGVTIKQYPSCRNKQTIWVFVNACISDALKQLLHHNLEVIPVFISFPVTHKQISAETKIFSNIQSPEIYEIKITIYWYVMKNRQRHLGQLLAFEKYQWSQTDKTQYLIFVIEY